MDETVSAILDGAVKILDVDRANLMIWEPQLKVLQTRWYRGSPPPADGRITLKMGEGIAGIALKYHHPYAVDNVNEDSNFIPGQGNIQSLLSMPMQSSDGKPLGVINALTQTRTRHFSEKDISFLGLFAKQAALAIENAMLHEEGIRTIGRLQELDQIKSEFLSRVSHELRGPLTAIQGFSEILSSKMNGDLSAKQADLLVQIQQQAKVQMRMVEDLLDLASIERGSWAITKNSCSIGQILKDEYQKAMLFAKAQEVKMKLHVESSLPSIEADIERLHQVVWNLLHNAIKYTRKGDCIDVKAELKGREILVQVQDTGVGIPKDCIEKIFEKFAQGHGDLSRQVGGLGLGLTLAKEIIEAHGGKIKAESEGEGKGSTFSFTLPTQLAA